MILKCCQDFRILIMYVILRQLCDSFINLKLETMFIVAPLSKLIYEYVQLEAPLLIHFTNILLIIIMAVLVTSVDTAGSPRIHQK